MTDRRGPTNDRGQAGQYEIRLEGRLDNRWAAWFDGLSLTQDIDGTTVLRGPVADQAALHGLLQKVRDAGLPLVSATCVEPDRRSAPSGEPRSTRAHQQKETDMTTIVRSTATNRVPMDAQRTTAFTVGVLFVLTLVFAIPGVLAYGPVLNDPFYVLGPGAGLSVSLGAFFEILTVIANIATAMVLFPLLRRQNETLALSYVAARFIEAALIVVGMLSLLAIETLRQDAAGADPESLLVASQSLVAVHDWTFLLGPGFMSGLGNGLLLGYLIYRSGLLSRRLTLVGIIGGPLVMVSGIGVLFGFIEAGSTAQGVATIPEIIWEIGILGLLLIFRGFQPGAVASLLSRSGDRAEPAMAATSSTAAAATAGVA